MALSKENYGKLQMNIFLNMRNWREKRQLRIFYMKKAMAISSSICDVNNVEEESAAVQLIEEVRLGDLVWVKINEKKRWPGQVVDGRRVRSSKPGKKVDGSWGNSS